MTRWQLTRWWHAALAAVSGAALLVQLALVIDGANVLVERDGSTADTAERILRFFSYFTIQSNLLAVATAVTLVQRPDRDGRWWRIVRVAALVGMTVTFVVYLVALRPIVDLHGVAKVTDIAFHYLAPAMTMVGWLLFGPRPRIDPGSLLRHLVWPVGYLGYVLALGALSGWYPYPFIDADALGYPTMLFHAAIIMLLLLGVGAVYYWLDKRLAKVPTLAELAAVPDRP